MSEGSSDNPDAEAFEAQIAAFFADYTDAFVREDADALAEMWDEVGLFPTPAGNFAMERAAFRDHCAGLMAFYRRQGVHKPEGRLVCAVELFPGVAQARMAYRMLGDAGAVVAEWDHIYILRRHDRWRVSLTIADGEMAAWQALGAEF